MSMSDTLGKGPCWHIYNTQRCDCILNLAYDVFGKVVSRCLPCGFRLPGCSSPMVGPSYS